MLTFFVITPIIIATFLFIASSNKAVRVLSIVFQSALFAASAYLVLQTRETEIVTFVGTYDDVLGIILRANTLSAVFVMLTTLIFLAVAVYTFNDARDKRSFWFLLFLMESSFIGLFLTGDLFNIFVLIEVSTLVIVILTMYDRQRRNMFYGKVFLMANIVAVQFYLLGLGYIYRLTGALDMVRVAELLADIPPESQLLPYVLIMTTLAFKCTLIPFFSWTPKVRLYPGSPTAVAAILSGLQIKSALYLFLRFQDIFGAISSAEFFLIVGIITGLFGAVMAISQTDVKLILAYHTVSQIGLIIIGVSAGHLYSHIGGLYHIISHAMFKTTLFLSTGIICQSYGTSDVYKIRGVMRSMPLAGAATGMAVLGIAGAPFFIGSISKYFIAYDVPLYLNAATIAISLGTIVSFIKFSSMFMGKPEAKGGISKAPRSRSIPVVALGAACLLGGIFGTQIIYFLFRYEVQVVFTSYVQKSLIFAGSCIAGYFIYKHLVKGNGWLVKFGAMKFGFKTICASIGAFFAAMLLLVGYVF